LSLLSEFTGGFAASFAKFDRLFCNRDELHLPSVSQLRAAATSLSLRRHATALGIDILV
jgi:hypothetical protein